MAKTSLIHRLYIASCFLLASLGVSAQCQPPTLVQVSESATDSLTISWFYFDTAIGWELELVPFGESPTLQPTTALITDKNFTFTDLDPASAYTVFIRTVCTMTATSDWNPISTRTNIPQPSPCLFSLPINNNNCNTGLQSFKIEVDGISGNLGDDLFLSSVDLIIQHTWPADLDIRLVSPSGREVLLSQNNGTVTDDYGDILDTTCSSFTRFSDLACTSITDGQPPFIGAFTPESPLFSVEDDTPANGIWTLNMCDRSNQDIGTLKSVNLNFEPLICEIPRNIFVKSINATEVEVVWSSYIGCELTEINLNLNGTEIRTTSVPCQQESIIIDDLVPGTEYEIYVLSNCLSNLTSPLSCPFRFTTACTEVSEVESFDLLSICTPGCAFDCELEGHWTNLQSDDQDWLLWNAPTNTDDTGPKTGVFGGGAYLYLEASPDICSPNASAILVSDCITVEANEAGCDLSFWYHMHGTSIGSLILLVNANAAPIADTLWQIAGQQGDIWQQSVLDLSIYDGQALTLRFVGTSLGGTQGDIAIDQIEFRGSTFTPGGYTYYQDLDQDGFGNIAFPTTLCSTRPSTVFVANALDCNDSDELINPDADEINCNGIDENCSGMNDDSPVENTIVFATSVTNELCSMPLSGSIELEILEGQEPYTYQWSNGSTANSLLNIASGVYSCTISDASMCRTETGPIPVLQLSNIATSIQILSTPACLGQENGSLIAAASNGVPPYSYLWSNGSNNDTLGAVSSGSYFVVVTDAAGCKSDTSFIQLQAAGSIQGDISFRLPIRCYGGTNGLLRADAITGISPFTYVWNTGQSGKEISGLSAGAYRCTITDASGCQAIINTILPEPDTLVSQVVSQENVVCFGERTGSIKTTVHGGVTPYSYAWNNSRNTDDMFDLPAGTYQLTITDANACTTVSDIVSITQPTVLSATVDSALVTSCILSQDGYISVAATGGIEPYNYFWSSSAVDTFALTDVTAGIYNVTITDDNNCKTTVSNYDLKTEALPIVVAMDAITLNKCANDSLAVIVATISEATAPIDYNWSAGRQISSTATADTLTLLPRGNYMVTVTDADGCIGIGPATVIPAVPPIVTSIIAKVDNICFDDEEGMINIATTGGNPPYSYLWSNGDTTARIENLLTGRYMLTVTDSEDCDISTQNISVASFPAYDISVMTTPSSASSSTGAIDLAVAGANPPYRYLWPNAIATPTENTVQNIPAGNYMVTVSDQSNCDTVLTIEVDVATVVQDYGEARSRIFPNPVNEILFVESTNLGHMSILICDMQGQRVLEKKSIESKTEIDMSTYPAGIYLVAVTTVVGTDTRFVSKL